MGAVKGDGIGGGFGILGGAIGGGLGIPFEFEFAAFAPGGKLTDGGGTSIK